ncbi:MAG: ATP-binding protein [Oligoflexus sp.]
MGLELFPKDRIVGVFRGFQEGGYEFKADLVLPYQADFQNRPMHGQFLLIQLETPDEAIMGRIASLSSEGRMAYGNGEEFSIRAVQESRDVPDDLRQQYLRYRVSVRILGVLRKTEDDKVKFAPSHRRLPHVGSPVAFPSDQVLREIVGHNIQGAKIGHFALGEFVYCGDSDDTELDGWALKCEPEVEIRFSIDKLVARRSFIFARAGYGKSNLNKLLFSALYQNTPLVQKRDKQVPVGTVIFDPDGEYFWPDDKGRPGLSDVPHLEDKLVVFTDRRAPSRFYQSFVAGGIRLDIRRLRPADIIAIALPPEKQDQQNVSKLKALDDNRWAELVDLIYLNGNDTTIEDMCRTLRLEIGRQDAEAIAARSNMSVIVRLFHDPSSQFMDKLLYCLSKGKLCVVDVSQMRGTQSLILSGLVLRRIFDKNQDEFTKQHPQTIPTIAVIEEAQSVLNDKASAAAPYVEWVKEGRKYDLGAVLVTQQPGSIPVEILSQGDNWFVFHLLSSADLASAKHANAHFSQDILNSLLNEPIKGQGVFWSSEGGTAYPVPLRVLSFNMIYKMTDPEFNRNPHDTFASQVEQRFASIVRRTSDPKESGNASNGGALGNLNQPNSSANTESIVKTTREDPLRSLEEKARERIENDEFIMNAINSEQGVAWGRIKAAIKEVVPDEMDDPGKIAYNLVPYVLASLLGEKNSKWETYRHETRNTTYVRAK